MFFLLLIQIHSISVNQNSKIMALNQKRKIQPRKESKMKSVKSHNFISYSDELLGGVVRESLNGLHFSFDSNSRSLFATSSLSY
jgi:hypothetical protein